MARAAETTAAAPPISPLMSFIPYIQKKTADRVIELESNSERGEDGTYRTWFQTDSSRIKRNTLTHEHKRGSRLVWRTIVMTENE